MDPRYFPTDPCKPVMWKAVSEETILNALVMEGSFPVTEYTESPRNQYVKSPNRDLEQNPWLTFESCNIEMECISSEDESPHIHSDFNSCTVSDAFDSKEDKTYKSVHDDPGDRETPTNTTGKISSFYSSDKFETQKSHTGSGCKKESTHEEGGAEEEEMRLQRQHLVPSVPSSTMPLIAQIPHTVATDMNHTDTSGIGSDITTEDDEVDTSQTIMIDIGPQEIHEINKHATRQDGYVYSGASSTGNSGYLDIQNSELQDYSDTSQQISGVLELL